MQKITPFLWFNGQAEEAAKFYTSIFKNSKLGTISRFGENEHGEPGKVMAASFELNGMEFTALNGGPEFSFTPAISFLVHCASQEEVDWYWEKLSASKEDEQCGWLKDKFGVSWQIIPDILFELMGDPDPEKAARVTQAMLQMKKIDIAGLKRAHAQG